LPKVLGAAENEGAVTPNKLVVGVVVDDPGGLESNLKVEVESNVE
jgi:hypothetical protein